ncbi:hypothetical protein CFB3_26590 [Clostridium folliculivorans]|nr:hypothetical protein CFB3_26590 [Clostridium folliculivorans]
MGIGYLKIQTRTGNDALPVKGAYVVIKDTMGKILHQLRTDASGNTQKISLYAPDKYHTLNPNDPGPFYATYEVNVMYTEKFVSEVIHNVQIFDTIESILPVSMLPLPVEPTQLLKVVNMPPPAVQSSIQRRQVAAPIPFALREVVIPDYITVHLGTPASSARDVRVKFADYIKNVASSEIYPTWPQASLEANIYAQISFALNRVFTEWYRSRGYSFDITNSTALDQAFVEGRDIFANISIIVDGIFNSFIRRTGRLEPFFAQFCNGTTVTCPGLSQWGTVTLANQGMIPLEILRNYYPNDIIIEASNNIASITESYPGTPLSDGSVGADVRLMQRYLNRIRANYPLIPQIASPNGIFAADTTKAVKTFQSIFNLNEDGIIDRATWYKIVQIFVGVTNLASLDSEGERIGLGAAPPTIVLMEGSRGSYVVELQFILDYIAQFYSTVPPVIQDGVFRSTTTTSVIAFQNTFGLTADGIVGPTTWDMLYNVYKGIEENVEVPEVTPPPTLPSPPFPGTLLKLGSIGDDVLLMQQFLNVISSVYTSIPKLMEDGNFGPMTQSAVIEFQRLFGLATDGVIGPITWDRIVSERNRIIYEENNQDKNPKSLFGIDINEYTQNVQFNIIATQIDFLYLRASGSGTGNFRVDKKFLEFAASSRNYGIPVGAYHYGVPSYDLTDADRQCDDFIDILQEGFGNGDYGDLFPVLDVETPVDKSITTATLVNWIDRFRKRFESKTRRRLMLYTGLFFIELYDNFYIPGSGYPLSNMPLWIAMYLDIPTNPSVPPSIGGWTRWRVWQFSESETVEGVGNPVDANWGPDNIDLLIQPGNVSGLSARFQNGNIYVSWNRNNDVDLLGYNIFLNKEWVGTVDENATSYLIIADKIPTNKNTPLEVSIEAFDYDGETSKVRSSVNL